MAMESLLSYILLENSTIKQMNAENGPNDLAAAHERVTKLVWKLKQLDPTNSTFIKSWNMLVDYGEKDLRAMLLYKAISADQKYTYAFSRLKVKIGVAISLLSIQPPADVKVPSLSSLSTSPWYRKRIK
ncbi:hypothetical protein GCM10027085_38990 [Spirosoma aerophilum]